MKMWVVEHPEGDFVQTEAKIPAPGDRDVLVRVLASSVNPLDLKIRAGQAAHARQPLPAVLGLDMAGVVEAVGAQVSEFAAGDEVYGMVGGVGGLQGTLAEYVSVDADLLAHKPRSLSMREAAALPLTTITAWEGMIDRAQVKEGQTVLVHAGAGGVGHVAVQLAVAYGAKVFATVSPEKEAVVASFGATPLDYTSMTTEQMMSVATEGQGFDIVYDTLGGKTLDDSFIAVQRYTGHVVSCLGWGTHALAPLSFRGATYSGVFTLMPLLTGYGKAHHGWILKEAAKLVDAGKLKPLMHEGSYSVESVAEAYRAAADRKIGKVVVELVHHD
jgi:NADPH2:quinone reductase